MKSDHEIRNAPEDNRKFVEALARGLEVLRCFSPSDQYLGNQEIARRTRLPKTTITRLTFTLTELGYLDYSEQHNKFCLGNAVIGLGYAKLAQMDIRRIARPLMQALAEHTQASVNLGIRDQLNMISMGRAFLAALPEKERLELLERIRATDEKNWEFVKDGIDRSISDYRELGYCLSLGNWRPEVHAIAVPLVLGDGTIMVFSCSGASFQLSRQLIETDIGPRLINLVGNVRTALTFSRN